MSMSASARILIFGHEPVLLESRCLILERAGFQVWTASEAAETASLIVSKEIDLLILCRSILRTERGDILTIAHEVRPEMKNLILADDLSRDAAPGRDTIADHFMSPEALLATAHRLTHNPPAPDTAASYSPEQHL